MHRRGRVFCRLVVVMLLVGLLQPLVPLTTLAQDESTPVADGTSQERAADQDGDGLADDVDVCPYVPDSDQADADGDGLGDACDDTPDGDALPDSDGDTIADPDDTCPSVSDPDQADSDGDGAGDACDDTSLPVTDSDGDGTPDDQDRTPTGETDADDIPDDVDNCPDTSNADQLDSDGDGVGDACDETPAGAPKPDMSAQAVGAQEESLEPALSLAMSTRGPFRTTPYLISYTFSITNNGSEPLTILSALYAFSGFGFSDLPDCEVVLPPDQSVSCTGTHIITVQDLTLGYIPVAFGVNARDASGNIHQQDISDVVTDLATPVTQENPTVVEEACVGGVTIAPTIILPTTEGVTYTVDARPPYHAGQRVTVTAQAQPEYIFPTLPPGWDEWEYQYEADYHITFASNPCIEASPVAPSWTEAACVGGVVTPPALTLPPSTDAVGYSVDAQAPYAPGQSVTVTATLNDGYGWPDILPEGWSPGATPATATYRVTFATNACTPVMPESPAVEQAACTGGEVVSPRITVPDDTDAIAYTLDGTIAPGETVTVTATLQGGYGWPETLPDGWRLATPATATLAIALHEATCRDTDPAVPEIIEAACVGGVVTEPTMTLPTTEGITYAVDAEPPYIAGQEVVVTATLKPGYRWASTTLDGWTFTVPSATYRVTFASVTCVEVIPVDPTIDEARCIDGVVTTPTLTLPITEGITYTLDAQPPYAAEQWVTVTATVEDGYALGNLPDGWNRTSDATATRQVAFASVSCPNLDLVMEATMRNGRPVTGPITDARLDDRITFTLSATNSGNVPLDAVAITGLAGIGCTPVAPASLDPGQALSCTGTYTISRADEQRGQVEITVGASGTYEGDTVRAPSASVSVGVQQPTTTEQVLRSVLRLLQALFGRR